MFTVVIVKGGQHCWALAFSDSLPLYFYECLCIVQFYLANKVSSSSSSSSENPLTVAKRSRYSLHCVESPRWGAVIDS